MFICAGPNVSVAPAIVGRLGGSTPRKFSPSGGGTPTIPTTPTTPTGWPLALAPKEQGRVPVGLALRTITTLAKKGVLSNSPRLAMFKITSLLSTSHRRTSFLNGRGCFRSFLRASTKVILIPPNLPTCPRRTTFIRISGPSVTFGTLIGCFVTSTCQFAPNVRPATVVSPATDFGPSGVRMKTCAYVKTRYVVKSKASVNGNYSVKSNIAVKRGYHLRTRIAVERHYGLNGEIAVRPKTIVNSSKFNFLVKSGKHCINVSRMKVIRLKSSISMKTGAAVSHTEFKHAVIKRNAGVSGLVRLNRGIIINERYVVITRSNVTNDAGIKSCTAVTTRINVSKRLGVNSGSALNTGAKIVSSVPRGSAC